MIGKLRHVALAVPDLEAAIAQYKNVFGAFVTSPVDLPVHGVRVAMVNLTNTYLELITPIGQNSPLKKFLKKNPQGGLHHLCYEVPDIKQARDRLVSQGLHVIGEGNPTLGYHGNLVLFFSPKDCLGALIELEEQAPLNAQEPRHKLSGSQNNLPHSLGGIPGIGIEIEVDFKNKTPEDNTEKE